MKNPFASFFHSMLERFRRPRRVAAEPAPSTEQFRKLLIETLDDPATARLLARRLLVPAFPIQGGERDPEAKDVSSGNFGTGFDPDDTGDYNFPNSKVGIGTNSPATKLHLYDASNPVTLFIDSISTNNPTLALGQAGTQWAQFYRDNSSGNIYLKSLQTNYPLRLQTTGTTGHILLNPTGTGNVGIGTTSPQAKLHVQSGNMSSDFYGTAAVETTGNTDLNLLAGASSIASLNFGDTDGNVGRIEYSNNSNSMRFYTNTAERMRIESDGDVGIGRSTPQAKLHVKGGGVSIEDDRGAGRLGFVQDGEDDPRTVLYRGGSDEAPDITILRNFPPSTPPDPEEEVVWTLMRVWAPRIPSGTPDREATISLVRDLNSTDDDSQEFVDFYNNGYASETQHGIRIQKRSGQTTAQYRDFVFDQFDGTTKTPLMILKADTRVGIGTTTPQTLLDVAGQARVKPVAFSALPAASSTIEGAIAAVTDSNTNTWGATISGGGTNHVLAYCDGTNWTVAAK
jgi:hypothetical protein